MDVYVEDLTEQSGLEQQIRAVQKLEAVGRLAGGVAHDFNNILVVIKLSTDMMLNQITPDSPLSKPLLQVSKAADRATALTTQMLAFSRRQMMQVRVVNVNSIVSDISHLLRRIIGEDVRMVTTLASGLANTKLDPDQLGQVVLNLAVNARDAMPGGGTLQLETSTLNWMRRTPYCILRSSRGVMFCWRSATLEPASRSRTCRTSSIPSSPPRKWARVRAWDCRLCTES